MKASQLKQIIREEISKVLNESISIKNDRDMIKVLDDIAANMTKWRGEEGAHYLSLLTTVIDYIRKSQFLDEGSKPATDATIRLHINTYTAADDPYEVAVEIGKKYNWNQQEIEKAEKIIRAKYIK